MKRDLSKLRVDRAHETLHVKTVNVLRQAILDGNFAPGDRLIERELCELTGVGRSSIREAMRQLEAEHLIEYTPHRGPAVTTVTAQDARDIYEMRAAVEGLAVRLFTQRASDEQVKKLEQTVNRYAHDMKHQDVDAVLQTTDDFFRILFEGADNRLAVNVSRVLHARMLYLRATITRQQNKKQRDKYVSTFRDVVRAIKSRDVDRADAAYQRHVEHAAAIALDAVADT